MTKKILWFDTETTGLTEKAFLYEISGIITIDGVIVEEFDIWCNVPIDSEMSPKALELQNLTLDKIMSFPSYKNAYKQLIDIFSKYIDKYNKNDKFIIAGHNISFDIRMLDRLFKACNDNYLGSFLNYKLQFDTLSLLRALEVAEIIPEQNSHKLEDMCRYFNIPLENAHNSLEDIKATMKLGEEILKIIKK